MEKESHHHRTCQPSGRLCPHVQPYRRVRCMALSGLSTLLLLSAGMGAGSGPVRLWGGRSRRCCLGSCMGTLQLGRWEGERQRKPEREPQPEYRPKQVPEQGHERRRVVKASGSTTRRAEKGYPTGTRERPRSSTRGDPGMRSHGMTIAAGAIRAGRTRAVGTRVVGTRDRSATAGRQDRQGRGDAGSQRGGGSAQTRDAGGMDRSGSRQGIRQKRFLKPGTRKSDQGGQQPRP